MAKCHIRGSAEGRGTTYSVYSRTTLMFCARKRSLDFWDSNVKGVTQI